MARSPAGAGLLALVLLSACTSEVAGTAVPAGVVTAPPVLEGTTWSSTSADVTTSAGDTCGGEQELTFRPDGYLDYRSRCEDEQGFRSYDGEEDDSTWTVDGEEVLLSFNDAFNVCVAVFRTPRELVASCENVRGDVFERVFRPGSAS
ncbi:hypothetical protein [Trujillonella humicola]|uniref:hypothetical protein n=1 Tax=Trujillonella humicola TaxID=3383699 RepID=UPI00390597C0